jgi:signal transduction histidine kinase
MLKDELGSSLKDREHTYLGKIETSAERLTKMIDGILAYSTLNSEIPEFETVNLNEIIRTICDDLELVIQQKKARIRCGQLPDVKGASFLLFQLFYNLISNSLKFSEKDLSPEIEISGQMIDLNPGPAPGGEAKMKPGVMITIQDNGIGFTNKDAEKIFKKFSRLNSTVDFEGTGLGLALCKKIVELHGGSIHASGKIHEGALFTVILPHSS